MPWVRLDENFADHPKVERVGPLAAWLHVAALCYSSRHLTDGRIPKAKATRLVDIPDPAGQISALLSEGMWVENGTDYVIHDYLDYQPSRDSVLAERSAARDRMAKKRSAARSGEVPPNIGRSSSSPSRPVPIDISQSSSGNSRANGHAADDDDLSTGDVPDETWDAYAELKLRSTGNVKNPGPWKRTTAQNARTELGDQASRWWHDFELTPRRLAECLMDGQIRNVPRRSA
jgi:hypothetical protein